MSSSTWAPLALALLLLAQCAAGGAGGGGGDTEAWLAAHRGEHHEALLAFLRFASVSADPARAGAVRGAGDWLRGFLARAGLGDAQLLETDGGPPAVFASRAGAPGMPTLLLYGHYDVQPADPEHLWSSPPWEPAVRDGRIFARGVSDDKGSVLAAAAALAAYVATTAPGEGVGIKVLFEGEEEVGSPHLRALLIRHRELLRADFAFSVDGGQVSRTQPGLCLGLRGATALQVDVIAAREDAHSGVYGGGVQNPLRALAGILARLHDADGKVAVPGFYDDVRAVTEADRELVRKFPGNVTEMLGMIGAQADFGEKGYSFFERTWLRPTVEIVGMYGGFTGKGIKTVLPSSAHAKLSLRIVGDQTPVGAGTKVKEFVERIGKEVAGVEVNVTMFEFLGDAYEMEWDTEGNRAAAEVLTELYGKEPVGFRLGGSIPFMFLAKSVLGLDTTMFAISYTDENIHAPNENWEMKTAESSEIMYVRLFKWFERRAKKDAGDKTEKTEL